MLTERPSQQLRKTRSADLPAVALLFLICLVFYLPRLTGPISTQDEGILLAYPQLILNGALPYRDFAALYTPGTLYVVSLAFAVFGESLLVERAVGLVYWWATAAALYFIGRPVSQLAGWLAACPVAIGLIFFTPGAYAMIGALALALGSLLAADRSYRVPGPEAQGRLAMLAGAAAGATIWFRQDAGLFICTALLFMFMTGPRFRLGRFIAGACATGVPLLVFLAAVGFEASFESLVSDVLRNGPGRKLPIEFGVSILVLLAAVALVIANAVIAHVRKLPDADRVLLRGSAIMALGLMPSVLQRADGWHIIYVAGPVLGLALVGSATILKATRPGIGALHFSSRGAACLAAVLAVLAVYGAVRTKHATTVVSGQRHVYVTSRPGVADLQATLDEVNRIARPGQRLFVGPGDLRYTNYNDSYLYFMLPQLAPSTRYVEMNPGVANRHGSGMANQLAAADIIVLNRGYDVWREPNASSVAGSDAASRVIDRRFCEHRSFGLWRILLRCPA